MALKGREVDPELCRYCIHTEVCYARLLHGTALGGLTSCDAYVSVYDHLGRTHYATKLSLNQIPKEISLRVTAEYQAERFLYLYKDAVDFITRIGRRKEYETRKRLRRKYKRGVWKDGRA